MSPSARPDLTLTGNSDCVCVSVPLRVCVYMSVNTGCDFNVVVVKTAGCYSVSKLSSLVSAERRRCQIQSVLQLLKGWISAWKVTMIKQKSTSCTFNRQTAVLLRSDINLLCAQ